MSRTRMLVRLLQGAALLCVPLIFTNMAQAGTVILEGSDAITFHCAENSTAGACTYASQVWKALEGPSSKPIAVIEGSGSIALASYGSGVTIDNFASVAAAGTLSNYAAVYFAGDSLDNEGPSGDTAILAAGAASTVSAYVSGGGTVMIEDYAGSAAWDSIVGTSGGANTHVAGAFGGNPISAGDNCDDGEKVTALGTANGFTQPPAISCWEHQAYDESFFGSLATPFALSFFDAAPGMVGGATTGWSGLLSTGPTLTGATPEPGTLLLLAVGLIGVFVLAGRRSRRPLVRVAA